jgi:hypothetical protein
MLMWGYTLKRLYNDVALSKKLLPNKRLFIIHGSLLSAFLVLYALADIFEYIALHSSSSTTEYTLLIIVYLFLCIENLLEMLTFFLVVKLMLPFTRADKENKSKFKKFLFNGFADKHELKAAVLA